MNGYGVMLGSARCSANTAQTNLLYCGEQYDSASSQYYLRARYYNPANGLFNQLDPYAGNMQDPQSLHKYLYCHANPVNGIDMSGLFADFTLTGLMISTAIGQVLHSIYDGAVLSVYSAVDISIQAAKNNWSMKQALIMFAIGTVLLPC
jgi:RHS repeat-associated protein